MVLIRAGHDRDPGHRRLRRVSHPEAVRGTIRRPRRPAPVPAPRGSAPPAAAAGPARPSAWRAGPAGRRRTAAGRNATHRWNDPAAPAATRRTRCRPPTTCAPPPASRRQACPASRCTSADRSRGAGRAAAARRSVRGVGHSRLPTYRLAAGLPSRDHRPASAATPSAWSAEERSARRWLRQPAPRPWRRPWLRGRYGCGVPHENEVIPATPPPPYAASPKLATSDW